MSTKRSSRSSSRMNAAERAIYRKKRRRRSQLIRGATLVIAALVLIAAFYLLLAQFLPLPSPFGKDSPVNVTPEETIQETSTAAPTEEPTTEDVKSVQTDLIAQADRLAAGYDYDAAITLIQSYEGYETVPEMTDAEGVLLEEPRTPQMTFRMKLPCQVPPYTLVRRAVDLSAK